MANFPNYHQMPKNSYPLNSHPVYSLVGTLVDIVIGGISKINKVSFTLVDKLNKVSYAKFNKIKKVQN